MIKPFLKIPLHIFHANIVYMAVIIFMMGGAVIITAPISAQAQKKSASISQENAPPLPESLDGLKSRGAQFRYLGQEYGLDGWIMVYRGVEQYFYVTRDQQGFVSGLLSNAKGDLVTIEQLRALQDSGEGAILDALITQDVEDVATNYQGIGPNSLSGTSSNGQQDAVSSPSEKLFADVSQGNWVPYGPKDAPVIYAFIDPTCPHCHDFVQELRAAGFLDPVSSNAASQGGSNKAFRVQLRALPVSRFLEDPQNFQKAAFMLASPNPQADFFAHLDGDENILPGNGDLDVQAINHNISIMQAWGLDAIPFIIYRDKQGQVKIIRGKIDHPRDFIKDLR